MPCSQPYTLRKSNKAKQLQLKITARGQLVVVVPARVSESAALEFLQQNDDWVAAHQHLIKPQTEFILPSKICLPAITCEWPLFYQTQAIRRRVVETTPGLMLHIKSAHKDEFVAVIKRWLIRKARLELTPWLQRQSARCQLPYRKVNFRGQKTLWGSCSREGDISLNYKLLFLPPQYVDYVLVHELCHTVHFDHSRAFWRLLTGFIDECQQLRYHVKRADSFVPHWLD